MPEQKDIIRLPQGDVEYTIRDIANLVLKSGSLTGVLIRAITRVARDLILQGVHEIAVIIEQAKDEIVTTTYEGTIRRRQLKIALTVQLYDAEITRVENLPPGAPGRRYLDVWLAKLEDDFYRQLASI